MFRMVPYTKNYLVNVEVKVTMAMKFLEDGVTKYRDLNIWDETFLTGKAINTWGRTPKPALDNHARKTIRRIFNLLRVG